MSAGFNHPFAKMLGAPGIDSETWETSNPNRPELGAPGIDFETWETSNLGCPIPSASFCGMGGKPRTLISQSRVPQVSILRPGKPQPLGAPSIPLLSAEWVGNLEP